MKKIKIRLGWITDDGTEPPQEIIDLVSNQVRRWLQEQGLEGSLDNVEKDGRKVAEIVIIKPETWEVKDVQEFSVKLTSFVQSMVPNET